jgi:hypothetical protein
MDSLLLFSYAEMTASGSLFWWIGQVLGIVGMCFNILSYQCKKQRGIVTMQLIASGIFMVHFFLLGALIGAVLNAISLFRAMVFVNRGKNWADKVLWLYVFIFLSCLAYVINFTLLKNMSFPNGTVYTDFIVEVLPVIGMVSSTFSMRTRYASVARKLSLITSPLWLVYNIINSSIAGMITEIFALISIITGIIRLDLKKKNKNQDLIYAEGLKTESEDLDAQNK